MDAGEPAANNPDELRRQLIVAERVALRWSRRVRKIAEEGLDAMYDLALACQRTYSSGVFRDHLESQGLGADKCCEWYERCFMACRAMDFHHCDLLDAVGFGMTREQLHKTGPKAFAHAVRAERREKRAARRAARVEGRVPKIVK